VSARRVDEEMRRRNLRVGLWVAGFMLALYAVSIVGVIVLN
jgi:hypothetical protein